MSALFSVVELEVGSRCNRQCSYCPVSLNPRPAVPVKMPTKVFDALTAQLADLSFDGRLSYHFYNEPLLRRDLDRLVSRLDLAVPQALQVLYTNGDLLDDERYDLLRTAGIDYFIVTRHSPGAYAERPFQLIQYSEDLVLTNRGGVLDHLPGPGQKMLSTPCYVPSEMVTVTVTGDVVLCYEDAHRNYVLGNVLDQHLVDIWEAPRYREYRAALAAGTRSVSPMCSQCSNTAHARPGLSLIDEPFLNAGGQLRDTVTALKTRSLAARRARAR